MAAARRLKLPVFDKHAVKQVKAGTSGAVPAVKIGERGVGKQVVWIRTPAARKAAGEKRPDAASPGQTLTPAEQRAEWVVTEWLDQLRDLRKALLRVTLAPWSDVHRLRMVQTIGFDVDRKMDGEQRIAKLAKPECQSSLRATFDEGLLSAMHDELDYDLRYQLKSVCWAKGMNWVRGVVRRLAALELHGLCGGDTEWPLPDGWRRVAELEVQALRQFPDAPAPQSGKAGRSGKSGKSGKAADRKEAGRGQAK